MIKNAAKSISAPRDQTDLSRLMRAGLLPILRHTDPDIVLAAARAMVAAGLRAVEITTSVPHAVDLIAELSDEFTASGALIGAGTVVDPRQAEDVVQAGARFLVSPVLAEAVSNAARRLGVPHVPAGFTPTEILAARRGGARLIKLFPAAPVGPSYLAALLGPFPGLAIMPVGGLDAESALAFVRAGAPVVGLGGALCPKTMADVEPAAAAAGELLASIDAWRS